MKLVLCSPQLALERLLQKAVSVRWPAQLLTSTCSGSSQAAVTLGRALLLACTLATNSTALMTIVILRVSKLIAQL